MKVYIFTEGSSRFGYGHVIRTSSLYEELERRGIQVQLVINGDYEVVGILGNKKFEIKNWLSVEYLTLILNEEAYAIVDSYLAKPEIYEFISKNTIKALFIDDNMRINYPNGIITNPSIYSDELEYPQNIDNHYMLGSEYVILRDSFLGVKRDTIRNKVQEILITLGGADIRNLTPPILKVLNDNYPNATKNVVVGNGFMNIQQIKNMNDCTIKLFYNVNAVEMKDLMLRSDFAISAAGQTIHELIKTETPFIPIQVADNQDNNIKGLLKFHLVNKILSSESKPDFKLKLLEEVNFMMNYENRVNLIKNMDGILDGEGSIRIIDRLLE